MALTINNKVSDDENENKFCPSEVEVAYALEKQAMTVRWVTSR